jgi:hypothetical protein
MARAGSHPDQPLRTRQMTAATIAAIEAAIRAIIHAWGASLPTPMRGTTTRTHIE